MKQSCDDDDDDDDDEDDDDGGGGGGGDDDDTREAFPPQHSPSMPAWSWHTSESDSSQCSDTPW
jgi:hypothetical protein